MSWARFSPESDVYLYEGQDGFNCCGCIMDKCSFVTEDASVFLEHLEEHKRQGHKVPNSALWAIADISIGWEHGKGNWKR